MSGLFATRQARRRAIAYVILVALTFVLMAFSRNPTIREFQRGVGFALRPAQESLDSFGRQVEDIFGAVAEIDRLRVDNQSLRAELERLRVENRTADQLRRENAELSALLQVRNGFEYETVAAMVIARESSEFRRLVTIGKGTDDGISVGDVVVAEGGALAGRVIEVGPTFARVLLITDTGSTVIGQLASSGASGEVVGQLGGVLIMSKIDATERVVLGEEVVTAGIELSGGIRSAYPRGLLIGRVVDVGQEANEVVQTASLEPAVAVDRVRFVLVIIDYEGSLPGIDEQPTDCTPIEDGGTLPDGDRPCATAAPLPTPTIRP